jgi:hypothetical protein
VTGLAIFAACSFAWGLDALLVVVALDGRNRIAHLLNLLHGGPRA